MRLYQIYQDRERAETPLFKMLKFTGNPDGAIRMVFKYGSKSYVLYINR